LVFAEFWVKIPEFLGSLIGYQILPVKSVKTRKRVSAGQRVNSSYENLENLGSGLSVIYLYNRFGQMEDQ